ncbi:MAG: hypothetical protein IAF94_08930 [Pirellulaceae bacterium]|nr:hypothetical protein [Pirellulaceae bacterium]
MNTRISLSVFLLLISSSLAAAEPQWIWSTKDAATKAAKGSAYFRKAFNLDEPKSGTAEVTADDAFELFLNGRSLGTGDSATKRYKFNLTPRLLPGRNVLAIAAVNGAPGPAGVAAKFTVKAKGKDAVTIVTDDTWKFNLRPQGTWTRIESDDSTWENAVALGEFGQTAPWGKAGELVDGITGPAILNKPRSREKGLFEFRDGDRVVFLGSGFIERLQNTGYLETMLTAAMPSKNITFRNLGWSGDTVWGDARVVFGSRADGFQRLLSDVSLCNPTVLIVCYGENEAYAGEAGLKDFRAGLNTLLDSLEATGARIVLLGPRQHEKLKPPLPDPAKYNADLRKYNDVIGQAAKEREHTFVDLSSVNIPSSARWSENLTQNGLHLSPAGDYLLSRRLSAELGCGYRRAALTIDVARNSYDGMGTTLLELDLQHSKVDFQIATQLEILINQDAREMLFTPWLAFLNLPPGDYQLKLDGKVLPEELDKRLDAAYFSVEKPFPIFEAVGRAEILRQAINKKNFLFFHRYRPQNETYLLLFRKHEQGKNAAEIPQFDPLIAELEKKIAELKKPVKQKYELIKVK